MQVIVYDELFNRAGFIAAAERVSITRRLFRPGEFELIISPDAPYAHTLVRDSLIMLDGDGRKCGFIERAERSYGPEGERLRVSGRTPEGLLARRLCVPEQVTAQYHQGWDSVEGPAETVMKHYVTRNCVSPDDPDRLFPGLSVAPDLGRGPVLPRQARFEPVSSVLEGMFAYTGMGYRVSFEPESRGLVFDVIEGRDMTAGQDANPRVVFGAERGNLCGASYIEDCRTMATMGYAGGRGQAEYRVIARVGGGSGYKRRETFLSCAGAETEQLPATGLAKLAARGGRVSLAAEVVKRPGGFEYELGDRVTVLPGGGRALDARITEITEESGPDGESERLVFAV